MYFTYRRGELGRVSYIVISSKTNECVHCWQGVQEQKLQHNTKQNILMKLALVRLVKIHQNRLWCIKTLQNNHKFELYSVFPKIMRVSDEIFYMFMIGCISIVFTPKLLSDTLLRVKETSDLSSDPLHPAATQFTPLFVKFWNEHSFMTISIFMPRVFSNLGKYSIYLIIMNGIEKCHSWVK